MNIVCRRLDELAPTHRSGIRLPWPRRHEQQQSLAGLLEAVARSLRSGASLPLALTECGVDEIARPVSRGVPLGQAIGLWAERSTGDGVPLAAAALALASEVGGAGARSLDAVADTLRERANLQREVHALSTQARASAAVICLSPLAFGVIVALIDPSSAAFLVTTSLGLMCLAGGIGLNALGVWWIRGIVRRASADRDAVAAQQADVIDLFSLVVGAGLNLHLALDAVASRAPPGWSPGLQGVVDLVDRGQPVADALDALPSVLGDASRPLARVLASSERYGTPLLPALERLAVDARLGRRRRAEEAARRVPVKLLFPLVSCVLPAFGLLTVAPLLAGALDALRL